LDLATAIPAFPERTFARDTSLIFVPVTPVVNNTPVHGDGSFTKGALVALTFLQETRSKDLAYQGLEARIVVIICHAIPLEKAKFLAKSS
jgi:hypothetical protein